MLLINKGPNLKSYGKKQRHNIEFRFSQANINSLLLNGTCELESFFNHLLYEPSSSSIFVLIVQDSDSIPRR